MDDVFLGWRAFKVSCPETPPEGWICIDDEGHVKSSDRCYLTR